MHAEMDTRDHKIIPRVRHSDVGRAKAVLSGATVI